eukprot:EG_transcript_4525
MLPEAALAFLHRVQHQPCPQGGRLAPAEAYRAACAELGIRPSRRLLRRFDGQADCYASTTGGCFNAKHGACDAVLSKTEPHPLPPLGLLEEIDLSSDFVGPVGCTALLNALPHLPHLTTLKLDGNGLTSEFVVALCRLLQRHPSMVTVSLANNRLVALPASRALLGLVESNRRIQHVWLQGTQVPASIVQLIGSLSFRNYLTAVRQAQQPPADSQNCDNPGLSRQSTPGAEAASPDPHSPPAEAPQPETGAELFCVPVLSLLSATADDHSSSLPHPAADHNVATSSSSSSGATPGSGGRAASPPWRSRRPLADLPYVDLLCRAAAADRRRATPPADGSSPTSRRIRWHHHCALWAPDTTVVPPTDPQDPHSRMVMSSRHHHPLLKPDTPEVLQGGSRRCAFCQWRSYHVFVCLRCDVALCISCFTPFHYCAIAPGQRRVSPRDCPDMQEFYTHIRRGDRQQVADILDASLDPTLVAEGLITGVCYNYPSPLVCAAYCGQAGVVEELLLRGADPTCQWLGLSAERWAVEMGHWQTAHELRRRRLAARGSSAAGARGPEAGPAQGASAVDGARVQGLLRRLGEDALVHVFQYLPPPALLRACATCSAWRTIIDTSCLTLLSLPIQNQPVDEVLAFSPTSLMAPVDWFGQPPPPSYEVAVAPPEDA